MYNNMQKKKIQSKFNTQNLSNEELVSKLEEYDNKIKKLKYALENAKMYARLHADIRYQYESVFEELQRSTEFDRRTKNTQILGYDGIIAVVDRLFLRPYDEGYSKGLSRRYNSNKAFFALKYPESQEEFNKFRNRQKRKKEQFEQILDQRTKI